MPATAQGEPTIASAELTTSAESSASAVRHPALTRSAVMISRALEVAGRLANDAAEVITATAGRGAAPGTKTSPYDWVTDTDRTLERHTRRVLTGEFPGIPVLGESSGGLDGYQPVPLPGTAGGSDLLWVVDPVDGTANYVAGLPWCGYSLALLDADGPLVGVIADPYQAQIYAAARGRGLRANGRVVEPAEQRDPDRGLAGMLICTELSGSAELVGGPDHPVVSQRIELAELIENCRCQHVGLRVLGSPALAVTQVALGRAAAAVLFRYQVWDVAGALALAAESGARISRLDGTDDPLPRSGLVVAAPDIAAAVHHLLAG
jgi:myo-inositol-1(or 4)-monophosphatase